MADASSRGPFSEPPRIGAWSFMARATRVLRRAFIPLVLIALVVCAPIGIWLHFEIASARDAVQAADTVDRTRDAHVKVLNLDASMGVIAIVALSASFLISGFGALIAQTVLQGRRATFPGLLRESLPRLRWLMAAGLPTFGLTAWATYLIAFPGVPLGMITLLGMSLLVLAVLLMLCLVTPAATVEERWPPGALLRGAEFARGAPIRILLCLLPLAVLGALSYRIAWGIIYDAKIGDLSERLAEISAEAWTVFGLCVLANSYLAALFGVIYHDTRQAKEGVDQSALAETFE